MFRGKHKVEWARQAYENANLDWKDEALNIVWRLARHKAYFTSDDVMAVLASKDVKTHNSSALGGVMVKARNSGWIRPAGFSTSTRKSRHQAPIRVWESRVKND